MFILPNIKDLMIDSGQFVLILISLILLQDMIVVSLFSAFKEFVQHSMLLVIKFIISNVEKLENMILKHKQIAH